MDAPQNTTRRHVIRASKDQRKLLFLAYEADKALSESRLDCISEQTGLPPDWISRWFARQKRSDKKRVEQGCIDLTVKRELLDDGLLAAVPQAAPNVGPSRPRKADRKKRVKREPTPAPEALLPSSPSLRWSSPMLPSSSPPRTPLHIAGPVEPWVYDDAPSSPSYPHGDAYSAFGNSLLGPLGGDRRRAPKTEDTQQESSWHSSFTCRTLPEDLSVSTTIHTYSPVPGHAGLGSRRLPGAASSCTPSHTCAQNASSGPPSGSTASAAWLDRPGVAFGPHSAVHEDASASKGNASSHLDGGRPVASAASSATDDGLELVMEELLAALEAETDVVKIAELLSQLHRLGLRW